MTCYVKDPDEFRDFLHGNLSLSESVVDGILGATVNVTEVSRTITVCTDKLLDSLGWRHN